MRYIGDECNQQSDEFLSPVKQMTQNIASSRNKHVSLKDLYQSTRGVGGDMILIAALSLATILPFGAVPGVPAIAGIALSLLFLNELMWFYNLKIPHAVSNLTVKRGTALKICSGMDKCFSKVENHVHEDRLAFLNSGLSIRIIAALGLVLSTAMVLFGFIPFVPTLLMLPVLMFSIGLIVKDGLFVAFGYICVTIIATLFLLILI